MSGIVRRIACWSGNVIEIINEYTGDRKINASKIDGLAALVGGETGGAAVRCFRVNSVTSTFGHIKSFDDAFPTAQDSQGDYMAFAVGFFGDEEIRVKVTRAPGSVILLPDANCDYIQCIIIPYTE